MSSIGSYTISPFINNRSVLSACGQGCVDSLEQFQVGTFTSGSTGTIGLSIQATLTPPLITANPADIKTLQLWVDNLRTENCDFSITTPNLLLEATTGELSLTSETLIDINNGGSVGSTINIESYADITLMSHTGSIVLDSNTALNGTLTLDDPSIFRKVTIQPASIEVRDTNNDPFGDPINVMIYPSAIQMLAGDGNHITSSLTATSFNIHNDEGVGDDLTLSASTLTISDSVINQTMTINSNAITAQTWSIDSTDSNMNITGSQMIVNCASLVNGSVTINNITTLGGFLEVDANVNFAGTLTNIYNDLVITDGVGVYSFLPDQVDFALNGTSTLTITDSLLECGTSTIHTNGIIQTTNLTVDSIANVSTLTLSGTILNINLDGYAISGSYSITINANVTVLNPTVGINGGVYKVWLTVGATPRTFSKACGVINNLLGDTVMSAGSVWLIEIYRRSAGTYRAIFTNFT